MENQLLATCEEDYTMETTTKTDILQWLQGLTVANRSFIRSAVDQAPTLNALSFLTRVSYDLFDQWHGGDVEAMKGHVSKRAMAHFRKQTPEQREELATIAYEARIKEVQNIMGAISVAGFTERSCPFSEAST